MQYHAAFSVIQAMDIVQQGHPSCRKVMGYRPNPSLQQCEHNRQSRDFSAMASGNASAKHASETILSI
ncbi:uncharacterized protein VTP21DRAFT_8704 [Calcarisporiella thermophila]|uniref:uncharacterized protein n=1 Tax=Calcarisporiella thermophila TaxID=911321 RepID=UPI0037424FA9